MTDVRNPGGDASDPRDGMVAAGFSSFDVADYGSGAAGILDLQTVDFRGYHAVVVASDQGGWLRQEELDILNARRATLLDYLNGGGGIVAFSKSGGDDGTSGAQRDRFLFVPYAVRVIPILQSEVGFSVTPFGQLLGLSGSDVRGNYSHGYFSAEGGMELVAVDQDGRPVALGQRGRP
ncbi:hypothetical protein HY374_00540 [Candidatus Berkelbacteria bacterium]|nr:hypothetical protein [Candidatus Berkelbacteria bacterium]